MRMEGVMGDHTDISPQASSLFMQMPRVTIPSRVLDRIVL